MRARVGNDHRTLRNAMTVSELIEALQDCDPDAVVVMISDYGDYHHTQQALTIRDCDGITCDQTIVEEPGYSRSGLALVESDGRDEDDEEESDAEEQKFVILR